MMMTKNPKWTLIITKANAFFMNNATIMGDNELKPIAVEVNTIYMMSLAMDLLIRDIEWRMSKNRDSFRKDKKQLFTRFMQAVKTACILQEDMTQDIYNEDEKHDYRNVQIWQEEANELARLMLLFADRSADQEVVDRIFSFIREQPAEGIVDEKMLDNFRLRKL